MNYEKGLGEQTLFDKSVEFQDQKPEDKVV